MFRFLIQFRDYLGNAWRNASASARTAYSLATAAVLTVVLVVGYWSSLPQYVALTQGRAPSEVAQVVSQLEAQNIPYQLGFAGSTVLVAKPYYNQARIAAADHLDPLQSPENTLEDPGFFGDPALNQHRLLHAKELELQRSIAKIRAIESADVHIAKPIPSPFERERKPATASVILQLRPDQFLTRQQAQGIASMVAGAVEGLVSESVSITDVFGNILWSESINSGGQIMERVEYQRRVEQALAQNAESLLEKTLGPGKAIVRVTARIDFNQRQTKETTYDAQSKVKLRENISTTTKESAKSTNGGIAGIAGNQPGTAVAGSSVPMNEKEESIETEYENPSVQTEVVEVPGKILRLTVAAMVDLGEQAATGGANAAGNQSNNTLTVTKDQVERIIKGAVGFDIERSDQIEVLVTKLAGDAQPAAAAPIPWEFYALVVRNASLGIAALLAFALGVMILRAFSQAIQQLPERMIASKSDSLRELASQAQRNPEVVSKILAAWLSRNAEKTDEPSTVSFESSLPAGDRRRAA